MKCADANAFVHAYVDGELQGVDRATFERHVFECDGCFRTCRLQARFKASVRGHLSRPALPEAMRRRIEIQIARAPAPSRHQTYPRFAPLLTAAAIIVFFVMQGRDNQPAILAQAMRTYQAGVPMDVESSDCAYIANWFRSKLDYAVKAPPLSHSGDCEGGRLLNVDDRLAAYFQVWTNDRRRLGVLVMSGDYPMPMTATHRGASGHDLVYIGSLRGSSGMVFQGRDGLIYVVVSDGDEENLTTHLPASYAQ